MTKELVLGLDIGGTGIKAAIVNTSTGKLVTERMKVPTPQPSTPKAIIQIIKGIVQKLNWSGLIGCGFPSVIKDGVACTAANIDDSWISVNVEEFFSNELKLPVVAINDADAAGITEINFGAGVNKKGTVLLLTLGTGIGSALFIDGILVPNTELGHLIFKGTAAEKYCSNAARIAKELTYEKWGKRLNKFLLHIERVMTPHYIILGGGVSKKFNNYKEYIKTSCSVVPAITKNEAGVIGAALAAKTFYQEKKFKTQFEYKQAI